MRDVTFPNSLAELRQADGTYLFDSDGGDECSYDSAAALIQTALIGFCGCGAEYDNLRYVLGGLEILEHLRDGTVDFDRSEWWKEHEAKCREHFGSDRAAEFFWYWLDEQGLSEHGTAIPGWLSNSGNDLLKLLREWSDLNEDGQTCADISPTQNSATS